MKWFATRAATDPRNSGLVSAMNGNFFRSVWYVHSAPTLSAMFTNGSLSTTSSATFRPIEILMDHAKTFFVTRVYSSTISAR